MVRPLAVCPPSLPLLLLRMLPSSICVRLSEPGTTLRLRRDYPCSDAMAEILLHLEPAAVEVELPR